MYAEGKYFTQNGYSFKGNKLCIYGTRELLLKEVYGGSLTGHYGESKRTSMLKEHYYYT